MKDASVTEGKTVECAPGGGNKKSPLARAFINLSTKS